MGAPVTITVQAQTAEAAANLNAFINNAEGGFRRVEQAAKGADAITAGTLKSTARALSGTATNLAFTASMFAGPQVQQAVYPLMLLGKEIKGVSSAMKLAGVTAPMAGAALAGLTLVVWTGVEAWKAYKAQAEEARTAGIAASGARNLKQAIADVISARVLAGQMTETEAQLMRIQMRTAQGTREVVAALGAKGEATKLAAEHDKVIAEFDKFLQELSDKTKTGLEADLAAAGASLAEWDRKLTEFRNSGIFTEKEIERLRAAVNKAYNFEANKAVSDDKLKATREWLKEQREAEDALFQAQKERLESLKEIADQEERIRQAKIQQIESDWRLTNAQKFTEKQKLGVGAGELGPDPNSFGQNVQANSIQMLNQIGTAAQNAASIVTNTLGASFDGISQSISGLILGTMTWGQALLNIGRTIVTTLINSFVQFFVNILARAVLNALVGTAIQSAAAASAAAIWAGPAILASTATFGAAAAQAPASVAAALATAPALGALGAVAGFAEGGFTGHGGRYEPAGIVHRGEFVMNASTVSRYGVPALESLQRGNGAATGSTGAGSANVKVIMVADLRQAALEAMKSDKGQEIVVQHVNGRRIDIGMIT